MKYVILLLFCTACTAESIEPCEPDPILGCERAVYWIANTYYENDRLITPDSAVAFFFWHDGRFSISYKDRKTHEGRIMYGHTWRIAGTNLIISDTTGKTWASYQMEFPAPDTLALDSNIFYK